MSTIEVAIPATQDDTLTEIRALPETPEPKTREQILNEAADLIERFGLCSGRLSRDGQFCLAGAVGSAATDRAVSGIDLNHVGEVIHAAERIFGRDYSTIYNLNDQTFKWGKPPERFARLRGITPEVRAVRFLRTMAAGASFSEAASRA